MTYEHPGPGALDYLHCSYGRSRLTFRGPRRSLEAPYIAFFGGSDTYGKFVETPFPDLVERMSGRRCVNFGCMHAGVDLFSGDSTLMQAAERAAATVIQVMGAQNMSNRFYAVHPRRNDRFLKASAKLQALYPEVDFTEFHFTRHLLTGLLRAGEDRFEVVVDELRLAWVARMRSLLERVGGGKLLLWVRDDRDDGPDGAAAGLGNDPLFIDEAMVAALQGSVDAVVEVVAGAAVWESGTQGMAFAEMEEPAATELPNVSLHLAIAEALSPAIRTLAT